MTLPPRRRDGPAREGRRRRQVRSPRGHARGWNRRRRRDEHRRREWPRRRRWPCDGRWRRCERCWWRRDGRGCRREAGARGCSAGGQAEAPGPRPRAGGWHARGHGPRRPPFGLQPFHGVAAEAGAGGAARTVGAHASGRLVRYVETRTPVRRALQLSKICAFVRSKVERTQGMGGHTHSHTVRAARETRTTHVWKESEPRRRGGRRGREGEEREGGGRGG